MSKLLPILVAAGVVAVAIMGWRLARPAVMSQPSSLGVLPTPTPIVVPAQADTNQMMRLLQTTVDDGGKIDLELLDQEVNQL